MAHEISEHHHAQEAPSPETSLASQIDPVCGMTVKPESPHASHYQGLHYRFCSAKCKIKFDAKPARYLAPSPVSAPVVGAEYVCPMHLEVQSDEAGKCPKCGMDLVERTKEEADHKTKGFLAEYIPANETWDNWTKMLAVRFVPGVDLDRRASAKQTADNITALKETDPIANVNVFWNEEKKEAIVDFLISSQVPQFLEHNMFRFLKVPKGIVSFQIARRVYLNNQKKDEDKLFIQDVVILRDQMMGEINSPQLTIPYSAK